MIKITNESDLKNWFKKNYKKLGFSKIVRQDIGKFPDFVMLENDKKIRVELEIKSSNFLLHKHPVNKVDKVICIENDINLGIPVVELKNFKIVDFNQKRPYSLKSQIWKIFNKNRIVTSSEIAKFLKVSWNTADSYLKELVIEGKLIRIKKEGVNLWLKK